MTTTTALHLGNNDNHQKKIIKKVRQLFSYTAVISYLYSLL